MWVGWKSFQTPRTKPSLNEGGRLNTTRKHVLDIILHSCRHDCVGRRRGGKVSLFYRTPRTHNQPSFPLPDTNSSCFRNFRCRTGWWWWKILKLLFQTSELWQHTKVNAVSCVIPLNIEECCFETWKSRGKGMMLFRANFLDDICYSSHIVPETTLHHVKS